jgi:O-antigen/teichoic acid export membrane protein
MRAAPITREAVLRVRAASAQNFVLIKNSAAIAIGTGASAALGFFYWWLAARMLPPEVIGRSSALLSLMGLVGLIGEAGLGTLLTGEIVRWPGRERGLVSAAGAVALLLSVAAASVGLALSGLVSNVFGGVASLWLTDLFFLVGCGLTAISYIVDQAFTGMLRASARMFRQLIAAGSRLALIAAVAIYFSDEVAILSSWAISLVVSIVIIERFTRNKGRSALIQRPDFKLLNAMRRKATDHYLLDLTSQAPGIVLPYLVTVMLSPTSNAAFFSLWMVFTIASVAPAAISIMLFPIISGDPSQFRNKMILSLGSSLCFAGLFAAFLFWFSESVLELINPVFRDIAGSDLRFLGFGMIGVVIKFQICVGARLTNTMRNAAGWFCLGAILELTGAILGCRIGTLEGLSIGWVLAVLAEAAFLLALALTRVRSMSVVPHDGNALSSGRAVSDDHPGAESNTDAFVIGAPRPQKTPTASLIAERSTRPGP